MFLYEMSFCLTQRKIHYMLFFTTDDVNTSVKPMIKIKLSMFKVM